MVVDSRQDCYFFIKSQCIKGASCTFRHNQSAKNTTEICPEWAETKQCTQEDCTKRHSEYQEHQKNFGTKNETPCYWELKGGCKNPQCSFKHIEPRNFENNPEIEWPSTPPLSSVQQLPALLSAPKSLAVIPVLPFKPASLIKDGVGSRIEGANHDLILNKPQLSLASNHGSMTKTKFAKVIDTFDTKNKAESVIAESDIKVTENPEQLETPFKPNFNNISDSIKTLELPILATQTPNNSHDKSTIPSPTKKITTSTQSNFKPNSFYTKKPLMNTNAPNVLSNILEINNPSKAKKIREKSQPQKVPKSLKVNLIQGETPIKIKSLAEILAEKREREKNASTAASNNEKAANNEDGAVNVLKNIAENGTSKKAKPKKNVSGSDVSISNTDKLKLQKQKLVKNFTKLQSNLSKSQSSVPSAFSVKLGGGSYLTGPANVGETSSVNIDGSGKNHFENSGQEASESGINRTTARKIPLNSQLITSNTSFKTGNRKQNSNFVNGLPFGAKKSLKLSNQMGNTTHKAVVKSQELSSSSEFKLPKNIFSLARPGVSLEPTYEKIKSESLNSSTSLNGNIPNLTLPSGEFIFSGENLTGSSPKSVLDKTDNPKNAVSKLMNYSDISSNANITNRDPFSADNKNKPESCDFDLRIAPRNSSSTAIVLATDSKRKADSTSIENSGLEEGKLRKKMRVFISDSVMAEFKRLGRLKLLEDIENLMEKSIELGINLDEELKRVDTDPALFGPLKSRNSSSGVSDCYAGKCGNDPVASAEFSNIEF